MHRFYFSCITKHQHELSKHYYLPSTSTSVPTTGNVIRLCGFFFEGLDDVFRSRSLTFFIPSFSVLADMCWWPVLPGRELAGKGNLSFCSPSSFFSFGERISFIFRPSASQRVRGSPLPNPACIREVLEDEEEWCFLDEEDEPECREWWLLLEVLSRLRSFEEECEEECEEWRE